MQQNIGATSLHWIFEIPVTMGQEFIVVKCFSCTVFQVQQVKKAKKWNCKMCGSKQSLKKIYGQGSGADCRKHVQKLNMMRGEMENEEDREEFVDGNTLNADVQIQNNKDEDELSYDDSKWSQFVDDDEDKNGQKNGNHGDDDDEATCTMDRKHFNTVRRENHKKWKKRRLQSNSGNDSCNNIGYKKQKFENCERSSVSRKQQGAALQGQTGHSFLENSAPGSTYHRKSSPKATRHDTGSTVNSTSKWDTFLSPDDQESDADPHDDNACQNESSNIATTYRNDFTSHTQNNPSPESHSIENKMDQVVTVENVSNDIKQHDRQTDNTQTASKWGIFISPSSHGDTSELDAGKDQTATLDRNKKTNFVQIALTRTRISEKPTQISTNFRFNKNNNRFTVEDDIDDILDGI
ncbi:uncharacterized protein LOC102801830 [Saccoglossus kowalevskii]